MHGTITGAHNERLDYLDGLRGFAACWVVLGHSLQAMKWQLFPFSSPAYAVDLFMLLSGFLMYYHAVNRADREPLNDPRSWAIFWTRRFFRIAPVYYVMLAVSFLATPYVIIYGAPYRFDDHSWQNILAHYTFVFGAIPRFHHETILPDWSIGLEMQFYLVFPFIALFLARVGSIRGSLILTACCWSLWAVIPVFMGSFFMASFLPLKLNMFLAGILIAETLFCEKRRVLPLVLVALALTGPSVFSNFGVPSTITRIALTMFLALLAAHGRLPLPSALQAAMQKLSAALGSRAGHGLGEISYGTYLTHVLLLPFVLTAVRAFGWSPVVTTLALLLVLFSVTFALAWVLHVGIERHGIAFGRRCIERLKTPKIVPQTAEA